MTSPATPASLHAQSEGLARAAALEGCPDLTFARNEYNNAARPDVELIAHHTNGQALIIIFYGDPAAVYPYRVIEGEDDPMFGHTEVNVDEGWGFGDMEDAAEHITEKAEEIKDYVRPEAIDAN